ncbi:hypothetical protein ACFO25_03555 [Paenactinomyces guangxiensis]|uniref:Uncharacterized protein n=1 Tax=Paenactinomyces guangxiensis TaxID=1490290 RepID=A0A7W1WRQ3_9BACL|nr:hypothetical protein [Paenactinomyces guangxiensis]MBA4494841.1 hypothetical protein [Paenactinomyces guangxiensis]MBH8591924.1 hypothetical protein [Paenactinomyces guangxiensis]
MKLKESLELLWDELEQFQIHYDPNKTRAGTNEILIGIGDENNGGVCLNNRRTEYESVTELLYYSDRQTLELPVSFHETQFYIEDLSPDSCLAFIFLYCLNQGMAADEFPEDWVDYVNKWEMGDVKTTGEPFQSWGCLHSALAQAHFTFYEETDAEGKPISKIDQANYVNGFWACVTLAVEMLLADVIPHEVPVLDHVEEYNRAMAFLRFEYQQYLQALKQATIIQLELPVKNSNRTLLVDAFIATENTYMGLLKSFLSNDSERTWLRSGFSLIALHRPGLKGSGNDIVISVDPNMNIHLKDLWEKLEHMENERWEGLRPCDQPRLPGRSPANQPWYDDMGRYTLVSAPKKINKELYGSKLEWSDVVSALWELYNPAKSLTVRPYLEDGTIGQSCYIYECQPIVTDRESQKQFTAVKWDSLGREQALVASPSMKRYLAVCASGLYSGKIPPIYPLPAERSFDFLELPCGFAVIHSNGILILDDQNNEQLDLPAYKGEFERLLQRVQTVSKIHAEISRKVDDIQKKLQTRQTLSGKYLISLHHWIAQQKMDLRNTILRTMPASVDHNLQVFRETVEKRWGLNNQLDELYESVAEIEHIITGYAEARTNRLISAITIYGFPFALFAGLFEFIFEGIPSPKWFGIHWVGFVSFLLFSAVSIVGISKILKRSHGDELIKTSQTERLNERS